MCGDEHDAEGTDASDGGPDRPWDPETGSLELACEELNFRHSLEEEGRWMRDRLMGVLDRVITTHARAAATWDHRATITHGEAARRRREHAADVRWTVEVLRRRREEIAVLAPAHPRPPRA